MDRPLPLPSPCRRTMLPGFPALAFRRSGRGTRMRSRSRSGPGPLPVQPRQPPLRQPKQAAAHRRLAPRSAPPLHRSRRHMRQTALLRAESCADVESSKSWVAPPCHRMNGMAPGTWSTEGPLPRPPRPASRYPDVLEMHQGPRSRVNGESEPRGRWRKRGIEECQRIVASCSNARTAGSSSVRPAAR